MTDGLRQLVLADQHRELGARFAPFAGWEMPVQYAGIVDEHNAVRQRAGVFDVSHMGRLYVCGSGAASSIRRAVTYNVGRISTGEAHYALMCNDDGGIIDDLFVYRLAEERFLVVNNAANVDAGRERIDATLQGASLEDRQGDTVMLAIQGPSARNLAADVIGSTDLLELKPRRCAEFDYDDSRVFVTRTGYTGEDGFEVVLDNQAAERLLRALVNAGAAPCGLGARDTLRLEAALPLYGNDLDLSTTPWEVGLGFAVTLDDGEDFAGRDALVASRDAVDRKLVCIRATGRGIMRAGCDCLHSDKVVGRVTSGGFSPTLDISIGMAYLPTKLSDEGTELDVDVRGKRVPATVVPRPFYRRKKTA